MTGIEGIHALTAECMKRIGSRLYPDSKFDIQKMEDLVLATEDRTMYPDIGTDHTNVRVMNYMATNADWINVCLFVNEDFRACFNDAIMIEKALLQVSDVDYKDFREDMVLASDKARETDKSIPIRFDKYNRQMEDIVMNYMNNGHSSFFSAGMTEAYSELMSEMSRQEREEVSYIAYNMIYVLNAMTWNGVFNKYVNLVIDSVKKQLSGS